MYSQFFSVLLISMPQLIWVCGVWWLHNYAHVCTSVSMIWCKTCSQDICNCYDSSMYFACPCTFLLHIPFALTALSVGGNEQLKDVDALAGTRVHVN